MDFGRQVGKENRPKSHQKWHRKKNEKMRGNFRKTAPQGLPKSGPAPGPHAPVPPQTPPYLSLRKQMQLQSASGMLSVIQTKWSLGGLPYLDLVFTSILFDFYSELGPILVPRSPPNRLPRRIWEPEPAQTPKMTPK